jgi:hypothetical protein
MSSASGVNKIEGRIVKPSTSLKYLRGEKTIKVNRNRGKYNG